MTFKSSRRRNATKQWWKFVPCTWASSREGPVSERRYSSWHCNWTGCSRSETRSDSCCGRRRDQVRQVRWCIAVQAAMYHHTQLVLDSAKCSRDKLPFSFVCPLNLVNNLFSYLSRQPGINNLFLQDCPNYRNFEALSQKLSLFT